MKSIGVWPAFVVTVGLMIAPGCGKSSDSNASSMPRIWRDDDAKNFVELVRRLENSADRRSPQITVYRWENGDLDGWVQFDDQPRRVPLDFQVQQVRANRVQSSSASPPQRYSGVLILSQELIEHFRSSSDKLFRGKTCWMKLRIVASANAKSS